MCLWQSKFTFRHVTFRIVAYENETLIVFFVVVCFLLFLLVYLLHPSQRHDITAIASNSKSATHWWACSVVKTAEHAEIFQIVLHTQSRWWFICSAILLLLCFVPLPFEKRQQISHASERDNDIKIEVKKKKSGRTETNFVTAKLFPLSTANL